MNRRYEATSLASASRNTLARAGFHPDSYRDWQQHNHPIELWSEKVIKQKVAYLHNNPVYAGFVAEPHHWLYSSANEFSEIKVLDVF